MRGRHIFVRGGRGGAVVKLLMRREHGFLTALARDV